MNWTADKTVSSVNRSINRSVYNNTLTQGDGIDLRIEMHNILYGTTVVPPRGHWICLRVYDRNKPTEFYNNITHEAVGGPPFEYIDKIIRTRRIPAHSLSDDLVGTKAGVLKADEYLYYIEWSERFKVGDDIYELTLDDHTNRPTNIMLYEKYKINRIIPNRMENGNIQYYTVIVKLDEIGY